MTMNEKNPGMVPVEEVAKELGTTALNVMMHIKRNLLEGREIDGSWFVTGESLTNYRRDGEALAGSTLCSPSCSSKSGCGSCA